METVRREHAVVVSHPVLVLELEAEAAEEVLVEVVVVAAVVAEEAEEAAVEEEEEVVEVVAVEVEVAKLTLKVNATLDRLVLI